MVSGVDSPVAQQNPLIEASTNVALVNQSRQSAILNTSQLVVGKQFQAEVVSSLEDGTCIVKIADVAARMQLPNSPEVGSKVSLTLIATSPRATFLLNPPDEKLSEALTTTSATLGANVKQLVDEFNQSSKSSGTGSTGLYLQTSANVTGIENANADPRLIIINAESADSAPANLSSAGKLINQLLQNTPQNSTVVNVSRLPIVNTPSVNVSTMAKALQSGVSNSGMFYESHLLQWAEGTLNVADLMKEPQAHLTSQNAGQAITNNATTQTQSANNLLANLAVGETAKASATGSTITLPKEATPLIQQQLQTLEQQRFVWHGELWPGQTMDWEISRDRQQHRNQDEPTWQSAVNFNLPLLGNVSAQLQLSGTHLRLTVTAQDATSAVMLQNHASELVGAMENTGTQLDSLLIKTKTSSTP